MPAMPMVLRTSRRVNLAMIFQVYPKFRGVHEFLTQRQSCPHRRNWSANLLAFPPNSWRKDPNS